MNYNVKRFTQPLNGLCSCNYAAVKSIGNLASNNVDYRQYNKGFFIKRLGEVIENIDHSKDHVIIESVVPPTLTAAKFIEELFPTEYNGQTIIDFSNVRVISTGGFLLVLNKETSALNDIHVIFDAESSTILMKEKHGVLYSMFTTQLSNEFVQALNDAADEQGKTMIGDDALKCKYDGSCTYHLYGFTS